MTDPLNQQWARDGMTDVVVLPDCKTGELVHHEEHDNSSLGPREAADFLTRRYRELSFTGVTPTRFLQPLAHEIGKGNPAAADEILAPGFAGL